MREGGRAIPCALSSRRWSWPANTGAWIGRERLASWPAERNQQKWGIQMKQMRPVLVLAGLGLLGILAMGSGAAAAQSATAPPQKIGSSLIGKLEGPEIILDAKAFPKT